MGSSYENSQNYLFAIKYLGKVINCMSENRLLVYTYIQIGNSYRKTENHDKAIINFQKALSLATENIEKYDCSWNLAATYSDQEKYYEAREYYFKSEEYYLKSISVTSNDVMRGKVHDEELGELYWNISVNYYKDNQRKKSDNYAMKSALCGYDYAIEFCKELGLDFEIYIE